GRLIRRSRGNDNQGTGEQFQSGANDNVSLQNRSWNNGDHGYDYLGASGDVHIGDVAYGNTNDGFSFEGNSPNGRLFDAIAIENGVTTREFDLWVDSTSAVGFSSNDNLFWNSGTQPPVKYKTTIYATVSAYSAASGDQPRVGRLTVTPASGTAPLAVTANASASSDPDGTIASYRFDFGDGTVVGPQPGATATHTYAAGTWTARVTVTDNGGAIATACATVTGWAANPAPG